MSLFNLKTWGTIFLFLFISTTLIWAFFHGGVPTHHLLQNKNLPGISNWWGILVMPILSWVTLGKIQNRKVEQVNRFNTLFLFVIGLTIGILLSVSFYNNYKPFLDNVLYLFLLLSIIIPIYRSEFILGFVLGMIHTFGAFLPTLFICVIAIMAFLIYRLSRILFNKVKNANMK